MHKVKVAVDTSAPFASRIPCRIAKIGTRELRVYRKAFQESRLEEKELLDVSGLFSEGSA